MQRRVVLTGCSGGGKSTLLAELSGRGFATVKEPGRRVIAAERASGGTGFPWDNIQRFSALAFWMAVADHAAAGDGITFFDRSALDQAAWYAREGHEVPGVLPEYDPQIFLVPPWSEIYETDADRQHGWNTAVREYEDLMQRLPVWGYQCHVLPKASVAERANWLLGKLGIDEASP